jgi:hypothetical protein
METCNASRVIEPRFEARSANLVWQDGQGKVWLSYNSSEYLKERHRVPAELLPNIAVVETLAATAAK